MLKIKIILLALIVLAGGLTIHSDNKIVADGSTKVEADSTVNYCQSNSLPKDILVSISKRHMWACAGSKTVYDSAEVTGYQNDPTDMTPTGTYKNFTKEAGVTLKGSDNTGSWSDPVSYWMPFLENQYGTYGFHDATWRANTDFGSISPDSKSASHGCVEMPLAASKWLYNWAQTGTQVTVSN